MDMCVGALFEHETSAAVRPWCCRRSKKSRRYVSEVISTVKVEFQLKEITGQMQGMCRIGVVGFMYSTRHVPMTSFPPEGIQLDVPS